MALWRHIVSNLFAIRSMDPKALPTTSTPRGPESDGHLRRLASKCKSVVAAWDNSARALPLFQKRQSDIKELFIGRVQCLGSDKDGTPKHPVRFRQDTTLRLYGD